MGGNISLTVRHARRHLLALTALAVGSTGCAELGIASAPFTTSVGSPVTVAAPDATTPTTLPTTPGAAGTISTIASAMEGPNSVATGPDGSLYVTDGDVVRRIRPDGTSSVFAGTTEGSSGDGGPATSAQLRNPSGLAVDGNGNVYISDHYNYTVRKVGTDGIIRRVAGTGSPDTTRGPCEEGPATSVALEQTEGLGLDNQGRLLLADFHNNCVRRLEHDGTLRTIGGNGSESTSDGPATSSGIRTPGHVVGAPDGSVYVSSVYDGLIRRISPDGMLTTVAGSWVGYLDGPAGSARFYEPNGMVVDSQGAIFIADFRNNRIRKLAGGVVSAYALSGDPTYNGEGVAALQAGGNALALAFDGQGRLVFTDPVNHMLRRID